MPTTWSQGQTTWTKRIDRAVELADQNPSAKQVLAFYSHVLVFQKAIYEKAKGVTRSPLTHPEELRAALDVDEASCGLPDLIEIVSKNGPIMLAQFADRLRNSSGQQNRDSLRRWLLAPEDSDSGTDFFARAVLQPQAERLVEAVNFRPQTLAGNRCPFCRSKPQLAVIRPEGDGGKRMLQCSLCLSEWEFRRILCPTCGEENHEKLPRYSAEGIATVRVEGCDTCRSYLKSVDLTVDGLAVPEVDEVATAPLDLWAAEHDYRKIQLNLMGF